MCSKFKVYFLYNFSGKDTCICDKPFYKRQQEFVSRSYLQKSSILFATDVFVYREHEFNLYTADDA